MLKVLAIKPVFEALPIEEGFRADFMPDERTAQEDAIVVLQNGQGGGLQFGHRLIGGYENAAVQEGAGNATGH